MRNIVVIAHNIRSSHNIGSILRTAEGFGVETVYLTGYSPYPEQPDDSRLPHLRRKLTDQIHKTALGAEVTQQWRHTIDVNSVLHQLRQSGYRIIGLEQFKGSISLPHYTPPDKCALVLGSEVDGLSSELIAECDDIIEIPMYGTKESFNVVQAAAVTLYALRET